ncbi:hypothetical protein RHGRI_035261 [Rhododendron griersonianum]|uniref:F-box associated beta-propeller type 1 domain-containing protein n=1 Tax=Rhododendron griersonianum TaxID=479676 RepID=A0AAV6I9L9_9ERIC|nr:hypothetical protein RHGRI_035261 [Rhododendron griersonianum]
MCSPAMVINEARRLYSTGTRGVKRRLKRHEIWVAPRAQGHQPAVSRPNNPHGKGLRMEKFLGAERDPNHLSHFVENYSFRFDNDNAFDEYRKPEFPFKSTGSCFKIVGSCNGLLCLSDGESGNKLNNLLLWNPMIGKSVVVPLPGVSFRSGDRPSFRNFGFGFDELRNDYKLVGIMSLEFKGLQPWAGVYSLNSGIWREISTKGLRYGTPFEEPVAYVNGVAHWFVTYNRKLLRDTKRSCILTFGFKDEVFGEMMLPETGGTEQSGIMTSVQD